MDSHTRSLAITAAIALAAGTLLAPARADDRALLVSSASSPMVFVVLDTSGSMNWAPPCSQADFDAGKCDYVCTRDCFVPRNADDPASKFRQAREALAEVIKGTPNVSFGFGTYNQDQAAALNKHWLYQVSATQPTGFIALPSPSGWTQFPKAGGEEVFGPTLNCTSSSNTGCASGTPSILPTFATGLSAPTWDLKRVRRLPKGSTTADTVTYFVQDNSLTTNKIFRVSYQLRPSQVLGNATIQATVTIERCTNGSCSTRTTVTGSPKIMNFDRVGAGQFLMWDNGANTAATQEGFFDQNQSDTTVGNTCSAWEANSDNTPDQYTDAGNRKYSIKQPTTQDPDTALRPFLDYGDVIPLNWSDDNRTRLLARLAPDGTSASSGESYSSSLYFHDLRNSPQQFLTLQDEGQRPLIAGGSTPLGFTLSSFRTWYTGCDSGRCDAGWRGLAMTRDPKWKCRKIYLLVITDGDDTCPGRDPCSYTAALKSLYDTKTFVVGYGLSNTSGNKLICMASNGGTGTPYLPQNKQELVDALNNILSKISEDSASFSSAAVPTVQAQVSDKIYLTSFNPLNPDDPENDPPTASGIWNGHIHSYLKPLKIDPTTNRPVDTPCGPTGTASCLAWDAAEALFAQAPTKVEVAASTPDLHIGLAANQRRVYYSNGSATAIPRTRKLFTPPTVNADKYDLWNGMGIVFTPGNTPSENAANTQSTSVIKYMLVRKHSQITREVPIAGHPNPESVDYVLGDVFHSNPRLIGNPSSFKYFMANFRGYETFFGDHRCRRRMLVVGANDGQLHAFDGGRFTIADPKQGNRLECDGVQPIGSFDNGTGSELFSYIPRPALPKMMAAYDTGKQDWSVDGSPIPEDVFIDPKHNGTPTVSEREWRTILVGGMREGGNAYYALDVTQPDKYPAGQHQVPAAINGYVPSCLADPPTSDCGTLPFPSELWEYTDAVDEDPAGSPGVGYADMAQTWSTPNLGRIRVCDGLVCDPTVAGNNVVDKFVMIVGGGLDAKDPSKPFFSRSGNYLYMIDVETGKAIYKQRLDGAAPAEPAAIDTDQDGYIDTVYIGTTAGYMYKIDISTIGQLQDTSISYLDCSSGACAATPVHTATVKRVVADAWKPFKIFDTVDHITGVRKPIYYWPSVIYVGRIGRYALAFGTGHRENLWLTDGAAGRLFLITDTGFTRQNELDGILPVNETKFVPVDPDFVVQGFASNDFVLNPQSGMFSGWYMPLQPNERLSAAPFTLSGVLTYTSFLPNVDVPGGPDDDPSLCRQIGSSLVYTVLATNGDPLLPFGNGEYSRFRATPPVISDVFTEPGQTKNPGGQDAPDLTEAQSRLFEYLKDFFPANCRFANYRVDIKGVRADTGVELVAPVPVCVIEKNWKEY